MFSLYESQNIKAVISKRLLSLSTTNSPDMHAQEAKQKKMNQTLRAYMLSIPSTLKFLFLPAEEAKRKK